MAFRIIMTLQMLDWNKKNSSKVKKKKISDLSLAQKIQRVEGESFI